MMYRVSKVTGTRCTCVEHGYDGDVRMRLSDQMRLAPVREGGWGPVHSRVYRKAGRTLAVTHQSGKGKEKA